MRDSFIFYRSFYEAIRDLPRDIQGEIYTAIMEYSLYGKETDNLKPVTRSIFALMKPIIEANNKKFENGKKGGRVKSENKPNPNQSETKLEPNWNQEVTKTKPKDNQSGTKPEPNVDVDEDVDDNKKKKIKKKEEYSDSSLRNDISSPKVENNKKISYADFVELQEGEYNKLVFEQGESAAKAMIEILNNYKGSSGKKYKSDYLAIRSWVIDKYNENLQKYGTKNNTRVTGTALQSNEANFSDTL